MSIRMNRAAAQHVRRGLTLTDVVIAAVAAVILIAAVMPQVRDLAQDAKNRQACAANLKQLGLAAISYTSNGKNTTFPRLYYQPSQPPQVYSAASVADAFSTKGPRPNDVSGALFHLLKAEEVSPAVVICPSDDAKPLAAKDIAGLSNFPNGRANLSYSYSNCYPSLKAAQSGWIFRQEIAASVEAPLMSDMNPGDQASAGPGKVAFNSPAADLKKANSFNHGRAGQNVLYCDGHVEWSDTPFAGRLKHERAYRDNIFVSSKGMDETTGKGGDIYAPPNDSWDSIMLPTRNDEPGKPLPTSQPVK